MKHSIIKNAIQTPDGTVLRSYHVHDYKKYKDANGQTYIVDGGLDYLRRNVTEIPAKELSLYSDQPHEIVRKEMVWGSRGPEGGQPLQYKPLADMDTDHLEKVEAILPTCSLMRKCVQDELDYRDGKL
jgi:hypothetical protein